MNNFEMISIDDNKEKIKAVGVTWDNIINEVGKMLHNKVIEELFDNESLFYYTSGREETKHYIKNLSDVQMKLAKKFLLGLLKNPENFEFDNTIYTEFKKITAMIEEEQYTEGEKLNRLYAFIDEHLDASLDVSDLSYTKLKQKIRGKISYESRNGIFGEILFYKTIDFLYADTQLLFSKFPPITAPGTYSHGADGIFVRLVEDEVIFGFGEAKFCNTIDDAIRQVQNSISSISRISNDISWMSRNLLYMKQFNKEIENKIIEIGLKDTLDSILLGETKVEMFKKEIYVFMMYGGKSHYLKKDIKEKLNKKEIALEGFKVIIICFPIIDKDALVSNIMKKVTELSEECNGQ